MKFLAKFAKAADAASAVARLREQYAGFEAKAVVFFASHVYDHAEVATLMRDAFPGALTFGCSSYTELSNMTIQDGALSAMAFGPEALERLETAVVENMSTDPQAVEKAVAILEEKMGAKLLDLEFSRHFGMTLFDGRTRNIENVMERIGNLSDIIFVGGHASDGFTMDNIHVYCDGRSYVDASVLAVFKPRGKFALLKTQSAESLGVSFIASKVDEATRTILEFDGRPAAEAYAEGIGCGLSALHDDIFLDYPLGLMAEGEPFIRAGRRILEYGGLQLFCSVREGQRLFLMKTGNIVAKTRDALAKKRAELGGRISALIDFDCAHRDLTLKAQHDVGEYARLFAGIESTGFATFGEAYIANVNQTSVMALFE